MEMSWSTKGTLYFQAYAKPNQKILYIDKRSTHRKSCLRAIPNGVLKRLARLTSKDLQLVSDQKIDLIYPEHLKALKDAKLLPTPKSLEIPMMNQLWSEDKKD